mmetsp:Transcript_25034/g.62898  ORF Transcript_25034/g.62898 Transcript_25034/m.62898 type:complete len:113 (+) Transcript_25034:1204-1542(+)
MPWCAAECDPQWDATHMPHRQRVGALRVPGGCRVPPPPRCQVNPTKDTAGLGNPYNGTYLFRSIVRWWPVSALRDGAPYRDQLLLRGPGVVDSLRSHGFTCDVSGVDRPYHH